MLFASDPLSEISPSTTNRANYAISEHLSSDFYILAILGHFKRYLSNLERQKRLVGTTSSIGSLSIESIFASPGPAPTQLPASSLMIGIIIAYWY